MKEYHIAVQREITPLYMDILNAVKAGRAVNVKLTTAATKTKAQLGYWHAVIVPHVREGLYRMGNEMTHAEVNKFLNDMFFYTSKTVIIKRGLNEYCYTLRTPRSKSGATQDEMSDVIEKVRRWSATDLGFYIPAPNEIGGRSHLSFAAPQGFRA